MRQFCLIILVAALLAPAAALAGDRAAGDGSLAVTGGNATITIQGRGLVYGHFDSGTLMVMEYKPDDPTTAISVGAPKVKGPRGVATYVGSDVRFLLPSGRYTIELIASGINMSAVGRGNFSATGAGTPDDGSYTVNGGKPQPIAKLPGGQTFGSRSG